MWPLHSVRHSRSKSTRLWLACTSTTPLHVTGAFPHTNKQAMTQGYCHSKKTVTCIRSKHGSRSSLNKRLMLTTWLRTKHSLEQHFIAWIFQGCSQHSCKRYRLYTSKVVYFGAEIAAIRFHLPTQLRLMCTLNKGP